MSNKGYLRSEIVLEKTQKLATFIDSNESGKNEQLEKQAVSQEEIQAAKWAALNYAHRIAVTEQRFKTLSDSAEKLFELMVSLCIDLLAAGHLKKILYQYRSMAKASANPNAFLGLVKQIIASSANLIDTDELQKKQQASYRNVSQIIINAFIEDEEVVEEELYPQQRYINFYKDTLTNILEVTRKLQEYEAEYHSTCALLINFCVERDMKDDLKKVCTTIRNHVTQIINDSDKQVNPRFIKSVSFKNTETIRLNLQTRMAVLEACLKCNLWRESHFILEELFQLMTMKSVAKLNIAKMWFDFTKQIGQMCIDCTAFDTITTFGIHQRFAALAFLKAFEIVDKSKGPSEKLKEDIAVQAFFHAICISPLSEYTKDICGDESMAKLKKLLKIQHYQVFDRDSIMKRAFSSHLLQHIPDGLKKLGFLLKEEDSMPEEVLDALSKSLDSLKHQNIIQYKDKLVEAVFMHNLEIVSNIFANISFTDLKSFLPLSQSEIVCKHDVLLAKIIDGSAYMGFNLKVDHSDTNCHLQFYRTQVDKSASALNAKSDIFTYAFIRLSECINSIESCHEREDDFNSQMVDLYISQRQHEKNEIEERLAIFEGQLRAKENQEKMEIEQAHLEKLRIKEQIEARHAQEEIAIQHNKKEEQQNMVKEVIESKQSEKIRLKLLETGISATTEITTQNFEQIQEIEYAQELKKIEELISRSKGAENDTSYYCRQAFKDNLVKKSTNQLKELAMMPNVFKETHSLLNELKAKKNEKLREMQSKFFNALEHMGSDLDGVEKKRRAKYNDVMKGYRDKLSILDDLETKKRSMQQENEKKLREIEEKVAQSMVQKPIASTLNSTTSNNFYQSTRQAPAPQTNGTSYSGSGGYLPKANHSRMFDRSKESSIDKKPDQNTYRPRTSNYSRQ